MFHFRVENDPEVRDFMRLTTLLEAITHTRTLRALFHFYFHFSGLSRVSKSLAHKNPQQEPIN